MTVEQLSIDFDRPIGRVLADAGMAQALDRTERKTDGWTDEACARLIQFASERGAFRLEEFRAAMVGVLPEPASHYSWGALTNVAAKRRLIRWTGRYEATTSPATHGHPVKTWTAA